MQKAWLSGYKPKMPL